MEDKTAVLNMVRSILVVLAFILTLAIVIFQWFEIDHYGVDIKERLFSSSSSEQTAAPVPAAQNEEKTEGQDAPDAVKDGNADEAAPQE